MNIRALILALIVIVPAGAASFAAAPEAGRIGDLWSPQEMATISSMRLTGAEPWSPDPSNAYAGSVSAAALGREFFHDTRLSANGKVSCATCHRSKDQFADNLPRGQGIGPGRRRTMPIMGARQSPFLFWDGRKDSLWSQALGPLEDAQEHGSNRVGIASLIAKHYGDDYEKVFGVMPQLQALPLAASPAGSAAERKAWTDMPESTRVQVNRIYANVGKAIAAFERTLSYGDSRFDRYAGAVAAGDPSGQQVLSPQERRGLRTFITRGQCTTCHNGPLLTDHAFHNTGVPSVTKAPDRGRYEGIQKLLHDEFNCLGPYSDARPEQCAELQFLTDEDATQIGSFRTPSLRNVALRPPYMHAGQFTTLEQVIEHYMRAPVAAAGRSEIAIRGKRSAGHVTIELGSADVQDLVAFLGALNGPVIQASE